MPEPHTQSQAPETPRILRNWKVEEQLSAIRELAGAKKSDAFKRFFWVTMTRAECGGEVRFQASAKTADTPEDDGHRTYYLANIVMQGGGVLGLAHAGFVTGLELAGIRFAGIGGTSAGSILAMLMTAIRGKDITNTTYRDAAHLLDTIPMASFIDGPTPVRFLIKQALRRRNVLSPRHWPGLLAAGRQLVANRGLNSGAAFQHWLEETLRNYHMHTMGELDETLQHVHETLRCMPDHLDKILKANRDQLQEPGLISDSAINRPDMLLKIMATSVPTGVKFEFPSDLVYLAEDYQSVSPAMLVRASMSIPFFFHPIFFRTNPVNWSVPNRRFNENADGVENGKGFVERCLQDLVSDEKYRELADLEEIGFLDGGLFSNLPADAFQRSMPDIPTITVPLVRHERPSKITREKSLRGLVKHSLTTAAVIRLQRDRDAIIQRDKEQLGFNTLQDIGKKGGAANFIERSFPVKRQTIDTGQHNWLNFNMSDEEKADLFLIGLNRAREFLESFND